MQRLKKILNDRLSGREMAKRLYMFLANKIIRINKFKVVFISFGGKSYSDNPRAISEKLNEMCPKYEIVWLFNNPEEKRKIVPDYVRCVKAGSFIALKELATAKFWVDNFTKPLATYKSSKQVYIQTWHGDRGFKKVLYDSPFISKEMKFIESEICDIVLSGSNYADKVYETAFHYTGKILKFGCPRNDVLIINDYKKARVIKEKLNINVNTKILFYTPTLRREAASKHTLQPMGDIDWQATLKTLEKKTSNDWICLVRAHSAVKGLSGIPKDFSKMIDVTSYEDISDLLLISDLLITDYSSSAGDFALLDRPIILFQNDVDDYIKYDRTFYFDLDKSPYMIAKDQNDLVKIIEEVDWDNVPQNCKEILNFYGTVETGKASEKVVEYILSKQKKNEIF